jgi:hypothetical protein
MISWRVISLADRGLALLEGMLRFLLFLSSGISFLSYYFILSVWFVLFYPSRVLLSCTAISRGPVKRIGFARVVYIFGFSSHFIPYTHTYIYNVIPKSARNELIGKVEVVYM